jgi:hypothetical protein
VTRKVESRSARSPWAPVATTHDVKTILHPTICFGDHMRVVNGDIQPQSILLGKHTHRTQQGRSAGSVVRPCGICISFGEHTGKAEGKQFFPFCS